MVVSKEIPNMGATKNPTQIAIKDRSEVQSQIDLVKLGRDLTRPISPKWWFSREIPLFQGNLGW